MSNKREMAIKRRRRFIILVCLVFLLIVGIIVSIVSCASKKVSKKKTEKKSTTTSSEETVSVSSNEDIISSSSEIISSNESVVASKVESVVASKVKSKAEVTGNQLDKNYQNILLVNEKNPLPESYDNEVSPYLVKIDADLRNNNNNTMIHSGVYPYLSAMVRAAQREGVNLKVLSPYRSYAYQKRLFENQVRSVGGDEAKAATVVARPGTSEHNTGLCVDFNIAEDEFESTPMFTWLSKHGEEYGFILRYPKGKQDITGIVYESWHWRFVGIKVAEKMNDEGICLEEYVNKYAK